MKFIEGLSIFMMIVLSNISFAQNLVEAVKELTQKECFKFDAAIIRDSKIESIEKINAYFNNEDVENKTPIEKTSFRPDGKPIMTEIYGDYKSKETFTYDSLGNLVAKSRVFPSSNSPDEKTEWTFRGDTLVKTLRFRAYQSSQMEVEECANYEYNTFDSTVTVRTNYQNHCENAEPAPDEQLSIKTLSFYPNNNVKREITKRGNRTLVVQEIDSCGYRRDKLPIILSEIVGCTYCLSKDLRWIYNAQVKTTVKKSDTIEIVFLPNYMEDFKSGYFNGMDSISKIIIYPSTRQFEVQTIHFGMIIYQAGNSWSHTKEIKKYNFEFKLSAIERYMSFYWDGISPRFDEYTIVESADGDEARTTNNERERPDMELFEYYENGMLKSNSFINSQGKLVRKIVYELSYFE